MSKNSKDTERLAEQDIHDLAEKALTALGVPTIQARDCAQILTMADLMGIHTHGIMRVISYGERLRIGGIKAKADIETQVLAPGMRRVNGDNALGPAIGMHALRDAMEAAEETGIAIVLCRGSNHFGPIAPYALMAAEEGFASVIASNASTTIAPTGGRLARLGNNPLGFGFPNPGRDPIILDMAISVVARGKIRAALKAGEPIPDTWATDAEGRPTSDPAEALKGFLLPVGGYKGYGLSVVVDLLTGVLSGASYLTHVSSWVDAPEAPQDLGHTFILIDTKKLGDRGWLSGRMEDFGGILHDTPPADPANPVILPGERELNRMRASRKDGVLIDGDTLRDIRAIIAAA